MKKLIIILSVIFLSIQIKSQDFNLDNKLYQTISWSEFFKRLEQNPDLVYFDIRTPGERYDTSQYSSYNQGKISGAIETDYFDFDKSYPEYIKHKNDTIYIYCSHSRRSRLLAKQLADSSFANVISINGGITYLNSLPSEKIPLRSKYYKTSLKYQLVSPYYFAENIQNPNLQYIDIRPDSVYSGISIDESENIFGNIRNVIHIPYDKIQENIDLVDKSKTIVLFDNYGEQSPEAANYLAGKGYKCSVLLFGLNNLTDYIPGKERSFLNTKYEIILPGELLKIAAENNTVIIDVRTESEFNGKDTAAWKNIGSLKNAINIPLSQISREKLSYYRGKKIVLYDIMMHDELFEFAKKMKEYGMEEFSLLAGGIFRLKWEIYNTEMKELKELLIEY